MTKPDKPLLYTISLQVLELIEASAETWTPEEKARTITRAYQNAKADELMSEKVLRMHRLVEEKLESQRGRR